MSFQQEIRPQAKAQTSAASTTQSAVPHAGGLPVGASAHGDSPKSTGNGLTNRALNDHHQANLAAHSTSSAADQAKVLAPAAKKSTGQAAQVAPALEAAARGESISEQAKRVSGSITMSAADALRVARQTSEGGSGARSAMPEANQGGSNYESPFVGAAFSGVDSDQTGSTPKDGAEGISHVINGDNTPHGYAAYGSNPNDYENDLKSRPNAKSVNPWGMPVIDPFNDAAAVIQYTRAADKNVSFKVDQQGGGKALKVDWDALAKTPITVNAGGLVPICYDNPKNVADLGCQAVMADIKQKQGNPDDKNQFISLLGHSGGGQSSFYTALKLSQDGYKNISLVGVDMVMTLHERDILEKMGVNVTNITSHEKMAGGIRNPSQIGQLNATVAGGGADYYDIDVKRQEPLSPLDASGRHSMTNDVNVTTTVRFAQYLDSIGQHGDFNPDLYKQFLNDNNHTGNKVGYSTANTELPGLWEKTSEVIAPGPPGQQPSNPLAMYAV